MKIWFCNTCHAEIPAKGEYEKEPTLCPICKSNKKGFYEEEREDHNSDEDKRTSKKIEEAMAELESYEEGCEPKDVKFNCEC